MFGEHIFKMSLFSTYCLLFLHASASLAFDLHSSQSNKEEVTNVVRELVKSYEDTSETFLLPLTNDGYPVEIGLNWYPSNILAFNEQGQYIEFRGYITVEWFDPALQWNTDADEITYVNIPGDKIWSPTLVVHESQSHDYNSVFYENSLAFVHRNGTVSWSSDVKTSTFCQVLQKSFPCDRQACTLTFSSAVHYQRELVFRHLNVTMPGRTITNGAWEAVKTTVPDCPNLKNLKNRTAIRFVVELKRRRQRYYVVTLVVPCFILSAFTSLVFLYPRTKDQRISLATMNLLTLFVYQELISSVGPPTGTSLLGTLVLITMFEAAAATLFCILSDRLSVNYPLLPRPLILQQTGNGYNQNTSEAVMNKSFSSETQLTSVTVTESSTDTSPTPTQINPENDPESNPGNKDSDDGNRHYCIKNVKKFDRTVALILCIIKCIICITFAFLFGFADNNPVNKIQCSDEYYFA